MKTSVPKIEETLETASRLRTILNVTDFSLVVRFAELAS